MTSTIAPDRFQQTHVKLKKQFWTRVNKFRNLDSQRVSKKGLCVIRKARPQGLRQNRLALTEAVWLGVQPILPVSNDTIREWSFSDHAPMPRTLRVV